MESVDQAYADKCIKAFSQQFFADAGKKTSGMITAAGKIGYKGKMTTGVSFDSKALAAWAREVAEHADCIEIKFGIYPEKSGENALHEGDGNRLTVFLCPTNKEGAPAKDDNGQFMRPINNGNNRP